MPMIFAIESEENRNKKKFMSKLMHRSFKSIKNVETLSEPEVPCLWDNGPTERSHRWSQQNYSEKASSCGWHICECFIASDWKDTLCIILYKYSSTSYYSLMLTMNCRKDSVKSAAKTSNERTNSKFNANTRSKNFEMLLLNAKHKDSLKMCHRQQRAIMLML